ncbi:MAG TPA: TetR/AcrR family transcriptional regulator [Actinomycetes bacterium]|nr:TetR/AcrR family transcriptional regulator [Actinomycetes bacterium]
MTPALSRRDRVRAATVTEIKDTARRILVAEGSDGLSLRAIAREMGMTAPALYRYFDSHEALVGALCLDLLDELTGRLEAARDSEPVERPVERLMAACREFRRWSLAHPREFQLTFASVGEEGPPGHAEPGVDISFGGVFLGIFVEIWAQAPFLVPPDEAIPEQLRGELATFAARTAVDLPLGALTAYLGGWVRLYGAVTLEVFGHLGFAVTDAGSLFEAMLADMRRQLTAES